MERKRVPERDPSEKCVEYSQVSLCEAGLTVKTLEISRNPYPRIGYIVPYFREGAE